MTNDEDVTHKEIKEIALSEGVFHDREYKVDIEGMDAVFKELLSKRKLLLQYVFDEHGFPKGAIVAVDRQKIGWSLVHHCLDITWLRVNLLTLPAIQRRINQGATTQEILQSALAQKWVRSAGAVRVPNFRRTIGRLVALKRALECEGVVIEEGKVLLPKLPNDIELSHAFVDMASRAERYFQHHDKNPLGDST